MKFKVGVIVPIYNVAKYLEECLKSIINQSYKNIFVVLVDDGSSDNSCEIAINFVSKYDNILLITKSNEGLSSARNIGINFFKKKFENYELFRYDNNEEELKFSIRENTYKINAVYRKNSSKIEALISPDIDYLMFIDPDDKWELDCVKLCVQNIRDSDVIWFDYKFIDELKNKKRFNQFWYYDIKSTQYLSVKDFFKMHLNVKNQYCFWFSVMGMFRFDLLIKNNLNFIHRIQHEDFHFGTILFLKSVKICIFNKQLYYVRIRENSITNNDSLPSFIQNEFSFYFNDNKISKKYYIFSSLLITLAVLTYEKKYICDIELKDIYDKYLIKFSRFVFQNFDFNYIYLNNLIYINGCIRDPYSVLSKYSKYSKYKEI
ncbi:glycosyltransferase, partial [Campylobacter jejuni]|nr:glycosyltransferase [Campylobacter jejuni]